MKWISIRTLAVAALITTLASALPAHAQTSDQGVAPIQVPTFPTLADVAAICNLDTDFPVGQLVIDPVANDVYMGSQYLDEILEVSITNSGGAFDDRTDLSQRDGSPGVEVVVAGSGPDDPANVYCYVNAGSDSGIATPRGRAPTVLEFYWSRGPCLLAADDVRSACFAYNGSPGDPTLQAAHYLQEHLVQPEEEPINMCGCPYDEGTGEMQRIAAFCASEHDAQGACPGGEQGLTGLETQATVTEGDNTCQRIVIGGRAMYIGDTC